MGELDLDRCAGVLVGLAAGDALGAGYEFGVPPAGDAEMIGGGLAGWEVGEWTDDTQMAICIAEEYATGRFDPTNVAARFLSWYRSSPADVGIQTRGVLSGSSEPGDVSTVAARWFDAHPRGSAGNGSLMRTAPVALAGLGDDRALATRATEISLLTHADPLAVDACVLWCVAVDRAVRQGRLDGIVDGLEVLDPARRQFWSERLEEARYAPLGSFRPNGFVVTALQAALAAVWQTPVPNRQPCLHLQRALDAAVHIGDDTDTVAAIAGALLGARWGASAVPLRWNTALHGWPGLRAPDLSHLAVRMARGGPPDSAGWPCAEDLTGYYRSVWPAAPVAVGLAEDPGVTLANVFALGEVSGDVTVSLCRVGRSQIRSPERAELWLLDADDPAENPNLDFVLSDLARSVVAWRDAGKTVVIHCVQAERRTPAAAAAYLAERLGISGQQAWDRVSKQLPGARINPAFIGALERLWP